MNRTVNRALCLGASVLCIALAPNVAGAQSRGARPAAGAYNDEVSIRTAAETSMSQVDLGKLAEQKSQNPEVKKFAQLMVEEHSKLTEQLKQLGMSERINLPTSVSRKDADEHRMLAKEPSGFDKNYTQQVASELAREIGEFKHGATATNKPALKDFYERTEPTLEAELQQARQLSGHVR